MLWLAKSEPGFFFYKFERIIAFCHIWLGCEVVLISREQKGNVKKNVAGQDLRE